MAILNQVGGISTGSISNLASGPLAALTQGLTKKGSFKYPQDLGGDPSKMHIVQFDICDVTPIGFDSAKVNQLKDSFLGGLSNTSLGGVMDSIKGVMDDPIGAAGQAISSAASKLAPNLSKLTDIQGLMKPPTTSIKSTISLCMPSTLAMNYNHSYHELSLADATGNLSRVATGVGSIADEYNKGRYSNENMGNFVQRHSDAVALGAEMYGNMKMGKDATAAILQATGRTANPQLQLVYKGMGLRDFTMEFLFTPKTKEESDQVSAIINTFIYASTPTINSNDGGMYMTPPSIFNVKFFMAKEGMSSSLTQMLQKQMNSMVSGLPIGNAVASLLPDSLGLNAKQDNARLFKVGDCVLESVGVDYAPTGSWAAYQNGAPVQTRLTLNFKELFQIDRTRLAKSIGSTGAVR